MNSIDDLEFWHPKEGEEVYISHAITKHKYVRAVLNYWRGGCAFVTTGKYVEYRLHARHTGMKPILNCRQ